jgi:hypothetical protein
MNYKSIYDSIISNAKSESRSKRDGNYYERHHIIPKSLGGLNNSTNLVLLTAREHFIAHRLLCEIYPENDKLKFAYWAMCNQLHGDVSRHYTISSREFQHARKQFSIANSNLHKGKKLSQTHIDIIKYKMVFNNPNKGKTGSKNALYKVPRTEEIRRKISETKLNNPKKNSNYKGDYITPYGTFTTAREASKVIGVDISTVISWCKNPDKLVNKHSIQRTTIFCTEDLGKSYRSLGWGFQPQSHQ